MGQTSAQSMGAQSPLAELSAYNMMMPLLSKNMAKQIPMLSNALTQSTLTSTPKLNALNLQQLQQYGPAEARIGNQIAREQALYGANTNAMQIAGAGGDAARGAVALNRELNPDYYQAMDAASKGAASAVNAINLNGLSPGEAASVERSLNQTQSANGNLGLVNPMNTINNAINFGGAFNNKIGLMNQTSGNAANVASAAASNGGVNPVNIALGQPNVTGTNFGTNQFQSGSSGSSNNAGSIASGYGSSLFGTMGGMNNAAMGAGASMANNTSPVSYINAGANMLGGIGSCCFIFMEAYEGKMPNCIRKIRDKYYTRHPMIATGYKRMAKFLVPLMRHSTIIRQLVWHSMIAPATRYASNLKAGRDKAISHFWLKAWAMIGGL